MLKPILTDSVSLDRVLCLPAPDIAALLRGQLIAVLPTVFIQKGWTFLLCPSVESEQSLSLEQQYRSPFLPLAKASQLHAASFPLEAWAKCEQCILIQDPEQLEALSSLTIWHKDALAKMLEQRQHLFLAFLRTYRIPEFIPISSAPEKTGKFVGLLALGEQFHQPLSVTEILPILSDAVFVQRQQQLAELRPPLHPELEELQSAIAPLITTHPTAQKLDDTLQIFLGWKTYPLTSSVACEQKWMKTITATGNSSDGHQFEKLVRQALIYLGFSNSNTNTKASLDPNATGGAGGIDVYCETPYPLVGECKASQHEHVPTSVSSQLIYLGNTHLGKDQFDQSIKVIFAAGDLTDAAEKVAVENQINIMRPETLQRLVEFQATAPGAINLIELKPCLATTPFGEAADDKINRYIDGLEGSLRVRSHIVESVKLLTRPDKTQLEVVEIQTCYNLKFAESPGQELDKQTVYELLIELSSPLTGYLGRIQIGSLNSDRFYFLREV
jgi:hypothetical protein